MGHRKQSKRQRKQKDRHSLKTKQVQAADTDFEAALPGAAPVEDSNALILPARGTEPPKPAVAASDAGNGDAAPAPAPAPPLSKSQQRKLRRIQEEKERREQRVAALQTLAAHQLPAEEMKLLRPLAARGQKETKRQALRRALALQRAGVELPAAGLGGVRLVQERPARRAASPDEEGEEESDEGSGGEERRAGYRGGRAGGPVRMEANGDASSDDGGSDDEEKASGARPSKRQRVAGGLSTAAAQGQQQQDTQAQQADSKAQLQQLRAALEQARRELGAAPGEEGGEESGDAGTAARWGAKAQGMGGVTRVAMVERRPKIQEAREGLPILGMEQEVMEAVLSSDVVVLCGETGCGKTTQVPQFLYEAGFGCAAFSERAGAVGVTQPRRVAAVSTAARVAEELGSPLGQVVGYQVRYDKRVGVGTALKFMTDGILLRELQEDFLLSKYSAILVDEAHERSLNTDILCGMLSRIVALRRRLSDEADARAAAASSGAIGAPSAPAAAGPRAHPLKLVIMSATLATRDFLENGRLFPAPPPLVSVPARQYPVTVHFSKRTELHDYPGAALKKARQIHSSLPPGGILVFLTGQREVDSLVRKLRAEFGPGRGRQTGAAAARRGGGGGGADGRGGGGGRPPAAAAAAWGGPQGQGQEQAEQGGARHGEQVEARAAMELDDALGGGDAAEADAADALGLAEEEGEDGEDGGEEGGAGAGARRRWRRQGIEEDGRDDYDAESSGDEEEVVVLGGGGFTPEEIAEAEQAFEERLGISLAALRGGGSGNSEQARVFRPPPPGHRLVVVATNVAETSLTIPGIRYVVDAGRSKQRLMEGSSGGLARFEVRWISKASAEQRAGRAGRTGPGHCYRLYSSAHFNDTFPAHTPPEILNAPLEGVALSLRALGVDRVANFPFPTPPDPAALAAAEACLRALGALGAPAGRPADEARLTDLGRRMARLPISPRHARMLLEAGAQDEQRQQQQVRQDQAAAAAAGGKKRNKGKKGAAADMGECGVLPYAVALAAAMSVESPFVSLDSLGPTAEEQQQQQGQEPQRQQQGGGGGEGGERDAKEAARRRRQAAAAAHAALRVGDSDALSALRALCAFEAAGQAEGFCRANYLHFRNLREAAALRQQLARTLEQQRCGGDGHALSAPLAPPPPGVVLALRHAVAAGWADQVARRIRSIDYLRSLKDKGHAHRAVRYACAALEGEDVFLHPNSALHAAPPEYVAYAELVRTAKRPYMAGLTAIEPQWLPAVAPALCTFSAPLPDPPPFYQPAADAVMAWRDVTFGRHDWALPRAPARHPDATERCAVFGAALLEGRVLPSLAGLKHALALPPSMLARSDTRVHKRADELLAALRAAQVDSRASLAAKWRASPRWLHHELAQWLQKGAAPALLQLWPQLVAEAGAE